MGQTTPYSQWDAQQHVTSAPATLAVHGVEPPVSFGNQHQPHITQGAFHDMQTSQPPMTAMDATGIWSDTSPPISLDAFDIPETMWSAFDFDFNMPVLLA